MKTEALSAYESLFYYMICDTLEPDFYKNCQILRDADLLDASNSETGATLLGLATALLLPTVAYSLLKYGADINRATGLIGEEASLPYTIALKRTVASHPSALYKPSQPLPSQLRKMPDEKTCTTKRTLLLECFLQHPKLDLNKREKINGSPIGKSVMDWAAELKIKPLTWFELFDIFSEEKLFPQRLQHRCWAGLNEMRKSFTPYESTIRGYNVNKIKLYTHLPTHSAVHNQSMVLMKSLEKKEYLVTGKTISSQSLLIDDSSSKAGFVKHQSAWEFINADQSGCTYCLYKVEDQWWACGRFEKSEVAIVRMDMNDSEIKTTPSTKYQALIEKIRGRLYYARCQREVVAMEWHRLFNSNQPAYKTVVDEDPSTAAVIVNSVEDTRDFSIALTQKSRITYLSGLAHVLCDIYITNDIDPNCNNFLIKKQTIIHIDGDRCWARLRDYQNHNRFRIEQSIKQLLEQKSLGEEKGYYFWNFFDKIISGEVRSTTPVYDWLLSMVRTPQFKRELNVALLKRIFLPKSFINAFVSYYIPHANEPQTLQQELLTRLAEVRNAALRDQEFKNYLQSAEAQTDLDAFLAQLESFEFTQFNFLFSHEDKYIVKIRRNLRSQIEDSKDIINKLCRKITSGVNVSELIKDIRSLPKSVDLNTQDPLTGATPLGLAITLLMPEAVKELLRGGAHPNVIAHLKNKEQLLPLTVAVTKAHVSTVESLYLDPDKAPDLKITHDEKTCSCALLKMKVLLALLADSRLHIGKVNGNGKTVFTHWQELEKQEPILYNALWEGEQKKISLIAYRKLNPQISAQETFNQVKKCSEEKISVEFKSCLALNPIWLTMVDPITSQTLLGLAITLLKPKFVTLLLEAKADINMPTGEKDWHLPITLASTKDHCSILKDKPDAKIISPFVCPRLTLLTSAKTQQCDCADNQVKVMDILLASPQLDINKPEKKANTTCLDWVSQLHPDRVEKLITRGAKKFAPT
jgi:hypothetical protein